MNYKFTQKPVHECLQQLHSLQLKTRNTPKYPSMSEYVNEVRHDHTMEYPSEKKKQTTDICDTMDESQNNYEE